MPVSTPTDQSRESPRDFSSLFAMMRPHFDALDNFLVGELDEFEPEIRELVRYCLEVGGKRIRPALVFLSGWTESGAISRDLVRLAAVIEMVHLATLVHDDIMDGADMRRNRQTAARRFGSPASVLLGDALFAHAVNLAAQFPTLEVCRYVSQSTRRVCSGEIIQTIRRDKAGTTLEEYFRIIELKTAELFFVSCHLGSRLAGYPPSFVQAAGDFGRRLGVAYQIYDDLADFFGREERIGKTLGTDLASGKVTLPLLLLLQKLDEPGRRELEEELRSGKPSALNLRIRQMEQAGVFPEVAATILREIEAAEAILVPFVGNAPVAPLLQLGDLLRGQLGALRAGGTY